MKDDLKHSGLGPIIQKIKDDDPVYTRYVEGCTDIMWHTQIQSPPLVLDFETKNKDWYKKFTSPGQNIDYIVWPAVFLYGNGPLLAKGIAQFIKRTEGEKNKTQVFHLQNEKEANTGMAETSVESNHSSTSNCENVLLGPGVNDRTYNFDESQRRADVETMRKEDSDKQTEAKRTKPAPINTSVKRPKNARK